MLRPLLTLLLGLLALTALPAQASDPCPVLRTQTASPDVATRIAAYACDANNAWFRPFIDAEGKVNGVLTYEAEASALANSIEAWQQVAIYWNDSGLLSSAYGRAGASECGYAASARYPSPGCRAFIIDTPWSAAFVSWVMRRAGLPGFTGSASHVNYVRDAYRNPTQNAYVISDPRAAKPAMGDLLCYVRVGSRVYGFGDLATLLSSSDGGLNMHCDIVVGVQPGNLAYLVGGNVAQAVTLRMLRLAPNGYFANLPARSASGDMICAPDSPEGCNSNRQDWSILLKLRPANELAMLPPPYVPPATQVLPRTPAQQCCVNCVVGSGIPRCPAGTMPPTQSRAPVNPDPGKQLPLQGQPASPPQQCCVNCTVGSNVPRCPAGTVPPQTP